jgi:hypothetical protein
LAQSHKVDCVVVAGDVFDDNAVGDDTLQQASDALTAFGNIPVLLLPGNHDPATADSALTRLKSPACVVVATAREPIALGDSIIYPCPLDRRYEHEDPTQWLPSREADEGIRIAVAHGGALNFGEESAHNRIDVAELLAKGFDYVALGDWHGLFRVDARAWYSGAPEATRFKEHKPGHVLLVDIDAPGDKPQVQPVPVNRSRWLRHSVDFHEDTQLDELKTWLDGLPERSWTLLELSLSGQLSLAARAALDALLDEYEQRLACLRVGIDQVRAEPTPEDLECLSGEGFVGAAVEILRAGEQSADGDALRLLHRLMQEAAR